MLGGAEEEEFAAAPDSEPESQEEQGEAGGMLLGNVVADRHGFQEPQAPPAMLHNAPGGLVKPPTFVFAGKGRQALDGRPLLLFDINGVLMQHRWNGTSHQHDLRPGVHHLLRLLPRFRLGVYSSATRPTIAKALSKLHNNLANFVEQRRRAAAEAAAPALPAGKKKRRAALAAAAAAAGGAEGVDGDGFPLALPHIMFEVVMARDHCQAASPEAIEARGGRPWDTVKPLGRYFADLAGVLLVDDSAHKADEGEGSNMLVMPCWHGAGHPLGRGDAVLPLLVDLLLERAAAGTAADLRRMSAGISAALADAAARQLEAAHAASQLSEEEAAAGAAALQAAVAGAAAVAAAAAALEAEEAADAAAGPQRQQGVKRAREEGAGASATATATAAPEVEAATEAAAAAGPAQQRLTKKQRREAKGAAAARDVLLAAAAEAAAGEGSLQGAALNQVNSYLNNTWPHLSLLLFKRTAKAGLAAACEAGVLQPLGGRAGKAGERYARTAAGDAAAASEQYMAELDAYCSQLPDHAALLARLEACSQPQAPAGEAAAAGAPAAEAGAAAAGDSGLGAGFFWEKPAATEHAAQPASAPSGQEQAAAPADAAVEAPPPPPPPPGAAAADLPALQQAVLLHAVGKLQLVRDVSLDQMVDWAEAALQRSHPELPLAAAAAAGDEGAARQRARPRRKLRTHLLHAMEACIKEGLAAYSKGKGGPNPRVAFEQGTKHPPPEQVQAALHQLAGMLGGGAAPAAAAAAPEAAAAPMLLDVFEDRAPPSAPPSAAGEAAEGAVAGGGSEDTDEAARKLREADNEAAALKAQLAEVRRQARREGLTGRQLSQRLLAAKVAALTGRPDAELAGLSAKALKKQARAAAKEKRGAAAGERAAAAAALLDTLFPAAAGGDDARWAAACAALSGEERELLGSQGIDLEEYRRQVATTGALAGPAASLGDWLGAGGAPEAEEEEGEEEGVGSAGVVDGLPEGNAAGVEAAAAARGGHYLRSCDAEAAAATAEGGAEQPACFFEQQQQQQAQQGQDAVQGPEATLAAEPQQQQQEEQPQEQPQAAWQQAPAPAGQDDALWQQQQYWAALQAQQEEALWRQQAEALRGAGPLSPLHHEVAALALRATPTPLEVASVQSAVLAVQETAASLWPGSRAALFGSQATGLALPGSDLDIVVLGVGPTLANAATGFTPVQRKQLAELLEDLLDALLQRGLLAGRAQIIEARVPIIKCRLAFGDGLAADISLGAENGAKAVDFVRRQVLAVPPLRPLCLVIKAFLRERCAHEVFTGGLSSYSVFNMIMAHLQLEGYQPVLAPPTPAADAAPRGAHGRRPRPPPPADLHETLGFLHQLAAGALPTLAQAAEAEQQRAAQGQGQGKARQGQQQGKAPPTDLGTLLWGFFDRFGNRFSYAKQAVSMRMGGVCLKLRQWNNARRPWALAVEDPQEMGKDIGGGSTAIREIKESFAQAAEMLAEVCEDLDANDAAAAAAAAPTPDVGGAARAPQQRPGHGPLLAGVLNVEAAVGRGPEAVKARAAMEAAAAAKSQATLHERIRAGVAVGRGFGGFATAKRAARAAKKAERLQRAADAGGEQQAGRRRGGAGEARQQPSPGGRKLGSKRGRAVEAAWGNKRGQYRDASDDDGGASLRKQKKGKAKGKKGAAAAKGAAKGAAAKGAASAKKQKRKGKAQGEGGGAAKRARKS